MLETKDGKPITTDDIKDYKKLYRVFGDSWRISQAESLFDYAAGTSTVTYQKKDFPDPNPPKLDPSKEASARDICQRAGVPERALAGCILDVAITGEASFATTTAAVIRPPQLLLEAARDQTKPITWKTTAKELKGSPGEIHTIICPSRGEQHRVWGTGFYTDDSSICTAAVHASLITLEQGGTITLEMLAGKTVYGASSKNGITTQPYAEWPRSFGFRSKDRQQPKSAVESEIPILWNTTGAFLQGLQEGKIYTFLCTNNGTAHRVWGTGIYTDDSSICTAAVHAGLISLEHGGTTTLEFRPGLQAYDASEKNGINTTAYGEWRRSFILRSNGK